MCGIAGFVGDPSVPLPTTLAAMNSSLRHRGPDSQGQWFDEALGLALGHRRLSILDTSSDGHQPMLSHSGRYVISFNGEIYNFKPLRAEIGEQHFRGGSDTEVALAAIDTWGIEPALNRFVGMFAIAVWDRKERVLSLVRDRLGKKPLYYGYAGKSLIFASELKALKRHPHFDATLNQGAIALFLRFSYIPSPYSVYRDFNKLEAGQLLQFNCEGTPKKICARQYWNPPDPETKPLRVSEDEACLRLLTLLKEAVKIRLQSDVPVGAFLSGGIDSSLVVAIAQTDWAANLNTFCIGYGHNSADEAPMARKIAAYLGTKHHQHYVQEEECLETIKMLPRIYDEPFADNSQIPTAIISRIASQQVTVALTGDGGDESFFGYERYLTTLNRWALLKRVPLALRRNVASFFSRLPSLAHSPRWLNVEAGLNSSTLAEFYRTVVSHHQRPGKITRFSELPTVTFQEEFPDAIPENLLSRIDLKTYLPDDILTKVDRASMAYSIEARSPFLDHRVVEFASTLDSTHKFQNGIHKRILKKTLAKYLPDEFITRRKTGFAIPLDEWLRTSLRPWAEERLAEDKDGLFHKKEIQKLWKSHLAGFNYENLLWPILTFQEWYSQQDDGLDERKCNGRN